MALAQNRLIAALWGRLQTKVGIRFTRFVGVAAASLATSEIALTICNGVFHLTATPAAIIAWFSGAVVSYVLSRWAWERKGKPDVLRETVPFWVISAMVVVILTLATKFAYHAAAWLGISSHGIAHVLFVDFIYLIANLFTFLLRFLVFHYVLFAEKTTAARAAATGPDSIPPGTRQAPSPAEAPHSAAPAATAEAAATLRAGGSAAAPRTGGSAATSTPAPGTSPSGTSPSGTPGTGTPSPNGSALPATGGPATGARPSSAATGKVPRPGRHAAPSRTTAD
jgi:putative flippase GtrA